MTFDFNSLTPSLGPLLNVITLVLLMRISGKVTPLVTEVKAIKEVTQKTEINTNSLVQHRIDMEKAASFKEGAAHEKAAGEEKASNIAEGVAQAEARKP